MLIICDYCKKESERGNGHVNRAKKLGMGLYCDRRCMGLARRKGKTKAQLVQAKQEYDRQYRDKNRAMLKEKKAAHHRNTYDPSKAAEYRKSRMPLHLEYCRRPEYRAWKSEYDRKIRAKEFGDFSESYTVLLNLEREIRSRASKYEVYLTNGTINKKNQRRRDYENAIGL